MESNALNRPDTTIVRASLVDDSARWSLSGLERAFEQALDEAFRIRAAPSDRQPPQSGRDPAVASEPETERQVERFRSCDGPI
jgi:hypothetical protein